MCSCHVCAVPVPERCPPVHSDSLIQSCPACPKTLNTIPIVGLGLTLAFPRRVGPGGLWAAEMQVWPLFHPAAPPPLVLLSLLPPPRRGP